MIYASSKNNFIIHWFKINWEATPLITHDQNSEGVHLNSSDNNTISNMEVYWNGWSWFNNWAYANFNTYVNTVSRNNVHWYSSYANPWVAISSAYVNNAQAYDNTSTNTINLVLVSE